MSDAASYHLDRQLVSARGYGSFGACIDLLDPNPTDTQFVETSAVPAGDGYAYLVSAEDGAGSEGTMGLATCVERNNFDRCP